MLQRMNIYSLNCHLNITNFIQNSVAHVFQCLARSHFDRRPERHHYLEESIAYISKASHTQSNAHPCAQILFITEIFVDALMIKTQGMSVFISMIVLYIASVVVLLYHWNNQVKVGKASILNPLFLVQSVSQIHLPARIHSMWSAS